MGRSPVKLVVVFLLIVALFCFFLSKSENVKLDAAALDKIEDFDILLAEGQSLHSSFVKLFNGSNDAYSHIGILVREGDKVYVLHATPDGSDSNGIRYDELQTFFDLSDVCAYTILRHPRLNEDDREKLNAEFQRFKSRTVPFDYDFNNRDKEKLYCSELVWLVFTNAGLMDSGSFDMDKPVYPGEFLKLRLSTVLSLSTVNRRRSTDCGRYLFREHC